MITGRHLTLANAGDSRAIVVRRRGENASGAMIVEAIDLTVDHKPDSPGEMQRILQMGGVVTPPGAHGSPSRVWHNNRGLAMSRSIGDHNAATVGVIAAPELTEYDLIDADYAIVIASDGVWEFLSSQTVAEIVAQVAGSSADVQDMCDSIIDRASYSWKVRPRHCLGLG